MVLFLEIHTSQATLHRIQKREVEQTFVWPILAFSGITAQSCRFIATRITGSVITLM